MYKYIYKNTGAAKTNRVVAVALYPTVKESFQIYYDITEAMGILIDRFTELDVPECVKVYEIFCRVGKQFDELDMFYSWTKTIAVARSSEYPEVEKITTKKLEVMDEFIRDKSALAQSARAKSEEKPEEPVKEEEEEEEPEVDMNTIKALPAPEDFAEPEAEEIKEEEEPPKVEELIKEPHQAEGDLLNLGEDAPTSQEHADKMALALFDDGSAAAAASSGAAGPGWEAFSDENADWETALVKSAGGLQHQKAALGGGFDMLLLNGMYQHSTNTAAMQAPGYGTSGSASSVALGSAGRPAMLALPAPPTSNNPGASAGHSDPFAASLAVAPPPYVQMSDMEKKQKLLMEEQVMWQQYARDGMQGQLGFSKLQQNTYNNYNTGGYTRT